MDGRDRKQKQRTTCCTIQYFPCFNVLWLITELVVVVIVILAWLIVARGLFASHDDDRNNRRI